VVHAGGGAAARATPTGHGIVRLAPCARRSKSPNRCGYSWS
jgi:hypothetical protein